MAILSSNMKRSIAISVHTVYFPTWRDKRVSQSKLKIIKTNENQLEKKNHQPFWMRIWERVKRPWMAAMCKGLFPSLLCRKDKRNMQSNIFKADYSYYWNQKSWGTLLKNNNNKITKLTLANQTCMLTSAPLLTNSSRQRAPLVDTAARCRGV